MSTYRTGNHWGVTIVREDEPHPAQLVAVVTTGDVKLAERICALLNGERPALTCICNDPPPAVDKPKNGTATRPDGWACPRHGVVL